MAHFDRCRDANQCRVLDEKRKYPAATPNLTLGHIKLCSAQIVGDVDDRYCWRIRTSIRNKNNAISCGTSANSCMGKNAVKGRVFILAVLHLPRRGTPTRLLGQRYGLEARPRRRGPAR